MASVRLDFVPPSEPDAAKLHILESVTEYGVYNEIEEVGNIGLYPNYISFYTTTKASNAQNFFAIQWEYANGVLGPVSQGVKGGTASLVGEIVNRVLLRDPTVNENVAMQEAEAAVESLFPNVEISTLTREDATAKELSGLTMLTMARVAIFDLLSTAASASGLDFTAGIVSVKHSGGASSKPDVKMIQALLKQAESFLGQSYSFFLLLKEIEPTTPMELVGADLSRLIVEFE